MEWMNDYLIFLSILFLYFIKHPSLFYQHLFPHFKVLNESLVLINH